MAWKASRREECIFLQQGPGSTTHSPSSEVECITTTAAPPRAPWAVVHHRPLHGGHEILRGIAGPSVRRTLRSNEHDPPRRSPSVGAEANAMDAALR